ncbi:MAG: helix-turn-helix domain-containing protein [Terrimicrobiaceae bacterium]
MKSVYDHEVEDIHRVYRNHRVSFYTCWYIRSGSIQVISDRGTINAGAGDWVFLDPLIQRSHYVSASSHILSIHFWVHWRGLDFLLPLLPPQVVAGGPAQKEMLRLAEALCAYEQSHIDEDRGHPSSVDCRRRGLFRLWLAEWHEQREHTALVPQENLDPRVLRMMAHFSTRISVAPVDFKGLGREVGLSRAQINRIFKQATGLTPRDWCLTHCFDEARELLQSGGLSIKEIADRLKFSDASHFAKWFRARSGCSPTDWRRQVMQWN